MGKACFLLPSLSPWSCESAACCCAPLLLSSIASPFSVSRRGMTTTPRASDPRSKPWLLVGLGNPGKRFDGTRHNIGFKMIDAIADSEGIPLTTVQSNSLFGKGCIGDVPVMLAKPQAFMNASGACVGPLVSRFNVPLSQLLVIYDDLDLPFARLRLLAKGGHGGHNGMRSIIDRLKGSREFPRLRIGIGRPHGNIDPADFVLQPFSRQECKELDMTLQECLRAVRILLLDGFSRSATFINSSISIKMKSG